jgi:hypothetical protein
MTQYCGIFAQSKKCGVTTANCYYAVACKQQQRNSVFCAVRADGCTHNNKVCHAIAKQQLHCNRRMVFSTQSVPKCYKQGQLVVAVRELLWFGRCELLLWEAGSWGQEPTEEGECPLLEAATMQRREDVTVDTSVCATVNCKVQSCTASKGSINPVINPKPIYSHTQHMW